ncbi:protein kinase [Thalassoglobus sp. JC818]|uniref:WD40 repeat domain-containing serine/threonine-protein kinase n=1 Tax=Thalassoglobus sp. JC818 TaxID=3232136 RepID=UPI00345824B8
MTTCPECGAKLSSDDLVVCPKCKHSLKQDDAESHSSETFMEDELPEQFDQDGALEGTLDLNAVEEPESISEFIVESFGDEDDGNTLADQTFVLPEEQDDEDSIAETADGTFFQDSGDADRTIDGGLSEVLSQESEADQTFVMDSVDGDANQGDQVPTIGDATIDVQQREDEQAQRTLPDVYPSAPSNEELKTLNLNWDAEEEASPGATIKATRFGGGDSLPQQVTESRRSSMRSIPNRSVSTATDKMTLVTAPEYELRKVLGEGGMGIVWSARQTSVDRDVAIKMIKGTKDQKQNQRDKFLAEAIVTSDLDHPNIVPIYDLGNDSQGALFYAMKQVQGTPWSKVINEKSLHENLEILLRTADAIAFAHARGVIHRDLKPENIMLGDFGEVLVMDWGLALPTKHFEKSESVNIPPAMGGTPAYMAPEMATGPINRISETSDVYLLGAMLWEIVTGSPPHPGKSVKDALLAAMRNTIRETDQQGELIEIARKAMSTAPQQRHQSVSELQKELRSYLDHSESLALAKRARQDLKVAESSGDYRDYSKAVFGFEQAHELWEGNQEARSGIDQANFAYATHARTKGDYDLALSLLSQKLPEHQELRGEIEFDRTERDARRRRLEVAKRTMAAMVAGILIVVTGAFFWIRSERNFAVEQQEIAVKERDRATVQQEIAEEQRDLATEQKQIAEEARSNLQVALTEVDNQREIAETERDEAQRQRKIADDQRILAEDNQRKAEAAKEAEEYKAYIARIGLASAKIEENAFDVAVSLLNQCPPHLRDWEWGRLMHLCEQISTEFNTAGPVDDVAVSPDNKLLLTASWDHAARIWDLQTKEVVREFPQAGLYVHSACWSPDQKYVALGGSDPEGLIRIFNSTTGEQLASFNGHSDAVLHVEFSPDGQQLISCSYDETARLWDVSDIQKPRELVVLDGHSWWVWDAAFAPDFNLNSASSPQQLVTVSQDGKAIVWSIDATAPETDSMAVRFVAQETLDREPQVRARQDAIFMMHDGPIYSVAYSPNGQYVATGGYDSRILLWNPSELPAFDLGQILNDEVPEPEFNALDGHSSSIHALCFSNDGELLISGGRDNSIKVWDTKSVSTIKTFRGHFGEVRAVDVSSDGRTIFSGAKDSRAVAWNIDQYEEIRVLNGRSLSGHSDAILNVAYDPEGSRIVTASRDRTGRIWNAHTGELELTLAEGHQFLTSNAVFLPDGRILATAAADDTVRLWDVATGAQILEIPKTGQSAVIGISFDGKWLLTGSNDQSTQLWRLDEVLKLASIESIDSVEDLPIKPVSLEGHHGRVTSVSFAPDRNQLVTCDSNGRMILWDAETAEVIWEVRHHNRLISQVAFTPDGQQILTACHDHTVGTVDASTGAEIVDQVLGHSTAVTGLTVSPDGRSVVSVSLLENDLLNPGSRVVVWDRASGQKRLAVDVESFSVNDVSFFPDGERVLCVCNDNTVRVLDLKSMLADNSLSQPVLDFEVVGGLVWSAKFDPDGKSILTVGGTDARLWDATTRREVMAFRPHGAVASASFSPDGTLVATGSWDNSVKIWNTSTGHVVEKLQGGHDSYVNSVRFSPDGLQVLTSSDDQTAKLWNVETKSVEVSFTGHTGRVRLAIFSPDASQVLTVSNDRTARLWDRKNGKQLRVFSGHEWAVLAGAFSPDGKLIATAGEDNTAKIWDAATGDLITTCEGHTSAVTSVAFSQDSARLFTASADASAKVWDATPGRGGTEIFTLAQQRGELTSLAVSPDGRNVVTSGRNGVATIWLTSDWKNEGDHTEASLPQNQ